MSDQPSAIAATALQEGLAERICEVIESDGLALGDRLNEKRLAERLHVSRSPVRAALDILARRGLVVRRPQRGVELIALPPKRSAKPRAERSGESRKDDLLVRIARERDQGLLGDDFSESELMQRYGVPRQVLRRVLELLADLHMVERKPGYGWRFLTVWNADVRRESYRFRMLIEPAAILEPGFALPAGFAEDMRRRHEANLTEPWTASSSVAFFEMNAAFHEGIAAASGNRFFLEAIRRQNRLRRFGSYNWKHGLERVRANYAEHMAILDKLEAGDQEIAAVLMRRHLEEASRLTPSFAFP